MREYIFFVDFFLLTTHIRLNLYTHFHRKLRIVDNVSSYEERISSVLLFRHVSCFETKLIGLISFLIHSSHTEKLWKIVTIYTMLTWFHLNYFRQYKNCKIEILFFMFQNKKGLSFHALSVKCPVKFSTIVSLFFYPTSFTFKNISFHKSKRQGLYLVLKWRNLITAKQFQWLLNRVE